MLQSNLVDCIRLTRPFTLVAPAMGSLCGFMLSYGLTEARFISLLLASLALPLVNAGGNTINQVFDIDIDRINRPNRPIPSGAVSRSRASAFGIGLYCSALAVASLVSTWFFFLTLGLIFMTLAYSVPPLRVKRRGWISNVWLAMARGPVGTVAAWSAFAPPTVTPLITGGIIGLFLVGAVTTKDFQDVVGDAKYGVKTLPLIYGTETAVRRITPFYILPFLLIPPLVYLKLLPPTALPLTLFSVYGALVARFTLRNRPGKQAWQHMYVLLGLSHLGFGVAYLCSYILNMR